MLALYRSGRQAEALEAYQRARRALVDEVGIEPGSALRELERKILNQDESLAPPRRAPDSAVARRRFVFAAAAVALVAVVVGVVLLERDSRGGLAGISPNSVGAIDPKSNRVVAEVPVGIRPGPVAAAGSSVWVGNLGDRTLTRVDAGKRSVLANFSLGNRTPTGLAVGAGAVWVAHGLRGELSRIDPEFGQILATLALATRSATGSVAVGAGWVWAAYGDSTLARIHPTSARPAGSTLAGAIPAAVIVARGSVWVANSADATVQRFDPATFAEGPVRPITVGKQPVALAYGAGAIWVADRGDDTVTRIDPATSSTITIPVGAEPIALAVGAGAVWVANAGDGNVSRIDPARDAVVRTIDIGARPAGIAVTDGLAWVSVQEP
jgi:YVTN family beta-propeller protein